MPEIEELDLRNAIDDAVVAAFAEEAEAIIKLTADAAADLTPALRRMTKYWMRYLDNTEDKTALRLYKHAQAEIRQVVETYEIDAKRGTVKALERIAGEVARIGAKLLATMIKAAL